MPPNAFAKAAEILAHGTPSACLLRGNEATLHPQLDELLTIADKRKVPVAVETSGLMPPEARDCLRSRRIPLLWRLYHPRHYTEEERDAMAAALQEWIDWGEAPIRLLITIDDVTAPPQFAVDFLQQVPIRNVTFRVLCSNNLDGMREITTFLTPHLIRLSGSGTRVNLDCGLPACAFSDTDFGRLAKLGIHRARCTPRPGILPDGRVYHCHRMTALPQGRIDLFKNHGQIMDYFYRRHNHLQWDLRAYPGCLACPCLTTRSCGGFGLAAKVERLSQEAARLEKLVARETDQDALADLGRVLYELCRYTDAEHCLLEARRIDPANPDVHLFLARTYWETARPAESEEEYRKAARLADNGQAILLELLKHYEQHGQRFKARRLAEEIKRNHTASET